MTRAEGVALALSLLADDDIVVAADGAIAREAYRAHDRARTFYMLGSMGQVASIALGLAMTRRERIVALDGDGNLLMGLGGLALVGGLKPPNLYHLVFDNGCYATTGGQPALSQQVDLAAAAAGAGYPWARRCSSAGGAREGMKAWLSASGPAFLDLAVETADPAPAPRIPMTPEQMAERVRDALGRT
ncbi:MAG: thiamine pyrophosphate-dependent enzyme [Thermoanaerobaculaceae bacterium]|jgi:thiamine pyrophosphate-dependent acetolactate synthase large subunit-like protein